MAKRNGVVVNRRALKAAKWGDRYITRNAGETLRSRVVGELNLAQKTAYGKAVLKDRRNGGQFLHMDIIQARGWCLNWIK